MSEHDPSYDVGPPDEADARQAALVVCATMEAQGYSVADMREVLDALGLLDPRKRPRML